MSTNLDALAIRSALGRKVWGVPVPFGDDGWLLRRLDDSQSIIVTVAPWDGVEWVHASIAGAETLPTYEDLRALHAAIWQGNGYAYQVFAPDVAHINIHEHALHLWGRLDGKGVLPDFGAFGTI